MAKHLPAVLPTTGRVSGTQRQISRRRLGVWEMLCCGQSVDDIAKHYKVTMKTIGRDIDWWEERLGYQTEELKKNAHQAAIDVGMTAEKLKKIAEDAYVEHAAAPNGVVKARFLQTSMHALVLRHKILADAGYLPKVGHEQESTPGVSISFEARFGKDAPEAVFDDPKSRRKVLEAAFKVLGSGISADIGNTGEAMNQVPVEMPALPGDDSPSDE